MDKFCYINQPCGLGDVLACEPIAKHYHNLGYKIKYWILEEYEWIRNYIRYIDYIPIKKDQIKQSKEIIFKEDFIYLPLIHTSVSQNYEWKRVGWLYDKYIISKLEPGLWKTFEYERNFEKENILYDLLNLKNKDYILINGNSSVGYRDINIDSKYEKINMHEIKDYTMLDWIKVMQNAREIHTVSTSILFPIIKINHLEVTIYGRLGPKDETFFSIKDVFEKFGFKYERIQL